MKLETFLLGRLALAAAFLAPAAAFAGGPTIEDVDPAGATLGTVVTITGSGFGENKPKVFLTQEGSNKQTVLKVLENSDTEIMAELRNGKTSGDVTLHVQPKGGVETTTEFFLFPPTILDADATDLAPKDEVELLVANVGNKKPKVKIGGKKAKVVSIEPAKAEGIALTVDVVTVLVPASLGNGAYDIELANKLGLHLIENAALVTMSDKKLGKKSFTAEINGNGFKTGGKLFQGQEVGGNVQVVATGGKNPTIGFAFLIPAFEVGDVPVTFTGLPGDLATLVYTETTLQGGVPDVNTWAQTDGDFEITATGLGGGQIAVDFEAAFSNGDGERALSGSFIADVPPVGP